MSVNRYECGLTNAPTEYQSPTMYQDENGGYVSYEDYAALEAECAALAAKKEKFAVECAATKIAITYLKSGRQDFTLNTHSTDALLAEVRASTIPEGYVLVPQEMHLSPEAMEGICFHCGDGGHNFGEFTDGTLFFGEVDYGDGVKVHGLHIATADYPEEGCATICEFAAQLRQDASTAELVAAGVITKVGE